MIKVIVVGKMNQKYLTQGLAYYQKQIPVKFEWIEVSDESTISGISIEGERILKQIKTSDHVIALAIKGKMLDSHGFAKLIDDSSTYQQGDLVFVIGGSYGLSDQVMERSNQKISFSKMTFPHQLMRLILIEQIYRGYMILKIIPITSEVTMKYIFWDFNGTVLDDAHLCYEILNEMLREVDRPTVTFEEYLMIFDFPVEAYYAKVYDLSKTSFIDLAHRFIEMYQPRSLNLKLHEGVIDAIKHYEDQGIINVMFSASEIYNLKEQLKHYKIDHLFKHILGTSDVYAKGKVEVAKRFITEHQIDPHDVTMIGDTLHDAEVALELGFKIILYTKGHQHPKRLKAFKTIDSMSDLYNII